MGGEKHIANFNDESGTGSPPRGRGKVFVCHVKTSKFGITPAWAGKSWRYFQREHSGKDHPRVGGEKTKKIP